MENIPNAISVHLSPSQSCAEVECPAFIALMEKVGERRSRYIPGEIKRARSLSSIDPLRKKENIARRILENFPAYFRVVLDNPFA